MYGWLFVQKTQIFELYVFNLYLHNHFSMPVVTFYLHSDPDNTALAFQSLRTLFVKAASVKGSKKAFA